MRLLLLLLLVPLSACGRSSPLAELTRLFQGGESEPDRLAIAEAESEEDGEGPQVRFALGRRAANAVLIQQQGERRMWRAPGGVVVATDGPRVVATAGLPQIVMATRFDGPDPLDDPRALLERGAEVRRLVDVSGASRSPETMRFGVAFDCRLRAARTEEGMILVEERCRVRGFPPVTNRFWASAETGQVGFAEQWVGPGMGPLSLDFEP
ncbi:hypothetical protein EJV46_19155 [Roseococcus sp. SYP-B2431]|uniref:YjbF family lipoprotein n=1 Tax=Roseococcus sp. SYP-B2431 TaxID=2496640 RepID=UPI00103F2B8C|nr:YjbF family lipoprotein [Roseococcus sp. SYP-B2431]TCH96700.1 hypothetical protein EJV46_19155 [Roseococcus sp. SYP-B2431]